MPTAYLPGVRSLLAFPIALLLITTACEVGDDDLAPGDDDPLAIASTAPGASFVYYNANTKHASFADIEKSDFRNFNEYMVKTAVPDIITLSEVGIYDLSKAVIGVDGVARTRTIHSCADVAADLSARVGDAYGCRSTGQRGGAAIIYRKSRFASASTDVRLINLETIGGDGICRIPATPWQAVAVKLVDKVSGEAVRVASIHLPTADSSEDDGTDFRADCSWRNLQRIEGSLRSLGGVSVSILGGDWNHGDASRHVTAAGEVIHDGWECAYRNATSADLTPCGTATGLGYRDVIFRACEKQCPTAGPTGACMASCLANDHWTFGGDRRIDFVLVKGGSLVRDQATIKFSEPLAQGVSTTLKYSDHRAIKARIYY